MNKDNFCIREFEINENVNLELYQVIEGQVSTVVWDASISLARYLIFRSENDPEFLQNKNVLELGSGLGLCGMTAAILGAKLVLMTDLKEAIPLLNYNMVQNKTKFENSDVAVSELTWSKTEVENLVKDKIFDYVLMSDCLYYEESIDPLLETLTYLVENGKTLILLAQELRESQKQINVLKSFFKRARNHLIFKEISAVEQDPDYQCEEIILYQCSKK